jgi:hypothetical protein
MLAKRNFTLTRDDGSQRPYKIGDEIEAQDTDHWYVNDLPPGGVRERMLATVPAAGSVQADPMNPLNADNADGPARDPADMHARMSALEEAHANHMDAVNTILARAGLTDSAKSLSEPKGTAADAAKAAADAAKKADDAKALATAKAEADAKALAKR